MKIIWWETILVIVIPLLFLAIFSIARLRTPDPQITSVRLSDLHTGDLLFVKYQSKPSKIIKIVTSKAWSHCGFVVNNAGDITVIELANYPDKPEYTGLCKVPIDEWLELNDDRLLGHCKWLGDPIDPQTVDAIVDKYKNIKLDMNLFNWSNIFFKKEYNSDCLKYVKKEYFCSEFIVTLLIKLKMLESAKMPNNYTPPELTRLPKFGKLNVLEN